MCNFNFKSFSMFSILPRRYFRCVQQVRKNVVNTSCATFCNEKPSTLKIKKKDDKSVDDILGSIASKYQVFRNEDSSVILDVNEENLKEVSPLEIQQDEYTEYEGLNLERGVTGVYEIEDLVDVLKRENSLNIFVATVPPEVRYVDYICVVSGRSYRHMLAIAQIVRKVYKIKCDKRDIIPKIEGETSKEWLAMDLGNIALHIFSNEARVKYDLDSLWSLGEEYDDECNKPDDPIVQMLQQNSIYLRGLEPADTKT